MFFDIINSDDMVKSKTAEILSELQNICFHPDSGQAWSAAEILTLLQNPAAEVLLAADNGSPAGFLMARRAADQAEILSLCVLPAYRMKTVGHQLIQQFYRRAENAAIREIFLEVNEKNTAARALYGKNGFEIVGRRPGYYGPAGDQKQDALVMKYSVK